MHWDQRKPVQIHEVLKYTFDHFLTIFPSWVKTLIPSIQIPQDDCAQIASSVLPEQVISTSDGSVTGPIGTYGYILLDKNSMDKITGFGRLPSTATDPTSQRSEIYEAVATVLVFIVLLKRYGIQSNIPLQHYMDNERVVELLTQEKLSPGLKQHLASDIDMYKVITYLTKTFNIKVQ